MIRSGIAIGGPVDGRKFNIIDAEKMMVPFRSKNGIEFAHYRWSEGRWLHQCETFSRETARAYTDAGIMSVREYFKSFGQ